MKSSIIALSLLVLVAGGNAQSLRGSADSAIPVFLSHEGTDGVGTQFMKEVRHELSKSKRFKLSSSDVPGQGLRFYVDVSTMDVSTGNRSHSVASLVIEEMGLPNSYPVPSLWYHKLILLEANRLSDVASQFLLDMDARWCRTIKDTSGGCPKEMLPPVIKD